VQEFLHRIVEIWFFNALSNPESAASVCKNCARMSLFLLARLVCTKKSAILAIYPGELRLI
jgi:hypothetical protein